jgi:copper homeostasis protein
LAYPLPCTFHKAFDSLPDYKLGIEQCIQIGFKHILSSGLKPTAIEGLDTLKNMIQLAANKINIIPGGGIRSSNITEIHQQLNCNTYHSAAITDNGNQANLNEVKQLLTLLECR